jgi:hypothetical protein
VHGNVQARFGGGLREKAERTSPTAYPTAASGTRTVAGVHSWPGIDPQALPCPMGVDTGTAGGNVVGQRQQQRAALEAAGVSLYVFNNRRHGGLVSAVDGVAPLIVPCLQA